MRDRQPKSAASDNDKLDTYPAWICRDCAIKFAGDTRNNVSTYHSAKCDVCGQAASVTHQRNFGYPDFNSIKKENKNG